MGRRAPLFYGKDVVSELRRLYEREGRMKLPVTVLDVLDDLAFIGLEGASSEYIRQFSRRRKLTSLDKSAAFV